MIMPRGQQLLLPARPVFIWGSLLLALALNTEGCTTAEALAYQEHYSSLLGIPVLLPLEQGLESLLPAIKALFP